MRSQYADVGTSASPTQDNANRRRQAINMGLLPQRSAAVPQNIGASTNKLNQLDIAFNGEGYGAAHTDTLKHQVYRDGEVNQLDRLVKCCSYCGYSWEVYVGCKRATRIQRSFLHQSYEDHMDAYLNKPANAHIVTMNHFSLIVNMLYGFSAGLSPASSCVEISCFKIGAEPVSPLAEPLSSIFVAMQPRSCS
jgi:hypothetical protein